MQQRSRQTFLSSLILCLLSFKSKNNGILVVEALTTRRIGKRTTTSIRGESPFLKAVRRSSSTSSGGSSSSSSIFSSSRNKDQANFRFVNGTNIADVRPRNHLQQRPQYYYQFQSHALDREEEKADVDDNLFEEGDKLMDDLKDQIFPLHRQNQDHDYYQQILQQQQQQQMVLTRQLRQLERLKQIKKEQPVQQQLQQKQQHSIKAINVHKEQQPLSSSSSIATTTTTSSSSYQSLQQTRQDDSALQLPAFSSFLDKISDVNKARLLLLLAAALYGTNFSLVKVMGDMGTMSVGLSTSLRFGLAALVTLPWLLQVDHNLEGVDNDASATTTATTTSILQNMQTSCQKLFDPQGMEFQSALAGMEVGLWNSIGYVAQAVGLETTDASKSAFLCSMAVVIVPLLDFFVAGKKILPRQLTGVALAVMGVAFLELGDITSCLSGDDVAATTSLVPFAETAATAMGTVATTTETVTTTAADTTTTSMSFGEFCTLIQPLAFGFGFWRMERAMHKYSTQANRITAGQLLAVFMGSLAYYFATTSSQDIPSLVQLQEWFWSDPALLVNLFWTGVITTGLTIYMETVALRTLSAAETTLIFCTEPLWGTAFAMILLGEQLGVSGAFGAIFILLGCIVSNLGWKGIISNLEDNALVLGLSRMNSGNNNGKSMKAKRWQKQKQQHERSSSSKPWISSSTLRRRSASASPASLTSFSSSASPASTSSATTSSPTPSYSHQNHATMQFNSFIQPLYHQNYHAIKAAVFLPYAGICTSLFARIQNGPLNFVSDTITQSSSSGDIVSGIGDGSSSANVEEMLDQLLQVAATMLFIHDNSSI